MHPFTVVSKSFCTSVQWACANKPRQTLNSMSTHSFTVTAVCWQTKTDDRKPTFLSHLPRSYVVLSDPRSWISRESVFKATEGTNHQSGNATSISSGVHSCWPVQPGILRAFSWNWHRKLYYFPFFFFSLQSCSGLSAGVDLVQMSPFRSYVVMVYVTGTIIFFGALHEAQPTFSYVIVSFSHL